MEILESEGVGEERGVLVLLSPVGPAVPPASRWASFRSRSFTWKDRINLYCYPLVCPLDSIIIHHKNDIIWTVPFSKSILPRKKSGNSGFVTQFEVARGFTEYVLTPDLMSLIHT